MSPATTSMPIAASGIAYDPDCASRGPNVDPTWSGNDPQCRRAAAYSVFLGYLGENHEYWGDPVTGHTMARAVVTSCRTTGFGDRFYWRGMTRNWGRGRVTLTEAGANW